MVYRLVIKNRADNREISAGTIFPLRLENGVTHMTGALLDTVPLADGGTGLFDWMARMRDDNPVWREGDGAYHVFRYADVERVLTDHAAFSNDISRINPELAEMSRGNLNSVDPPEHTKLRRLVSKVFTPRTVAALEPRIAALAGELLDDARDGAFDLVDALTFPLPVIVISELLGVPASDRHLFRQWIDRLLNAQGQTAREGITSDTAAYAELLEQVTKDMAAYLAEHCRERRLRPRDDLISRLACAEVDGERLSEDEVVKFADIVFMAGSVTTTLLLGSSVLCLDEHPAALAALRADPGAIPGAIEEVLRYRSPFSTASRITAVEVELSGTVIPANQSVTPWLMSANHDDRRFADPSRFDIHRDPNPHLAFSHGIHFCIGAPLARMETRIALEVLLRRFGSLRVDRDVEIGYHERGMWGPKNLPVIAGRAADV